MLNQIRPPSNQKMSITCKNESITAEIIELLLGACPSSVHQRNNSNALPIHSLCDLKDMYDEMDETQIQMDEVAIDILRLLLEAHPGSVSETADDGELPLHVAATSKAPAFCKVLVDAYPESVRRGNNIGELPFHNACGDGRPDTVEYLFGQYPESLNISDNRGYLPIHCAANSPGDNTAGIINFLLIHDPECLSKPVASDFGSDDDGSLPLHLCMSLQQAKHQLFVKF